MIELPECKYQCDCQQCYYTGKRCKHPEIYHKYDKQPFCSEILLKGECPEGKGVERNE